MTPSSMPFLLHALLALAATAAAQAPSPGDGSTGARVEPGPGERSAHATVYHESLRRTILLGGVDEAQDGGVWGWDGRHWQQLGSTSGPGSRGHFALAYDPVRDRLLLHGGFGLRFGRDGGTRHGDLWAWDGRAWDRLEDGSSGGPGVRDHHAMAWDRRRQEIVLFGGVRGTPGDQVLLGDTWIRDDGGWRRHEGDGPPARATHRLAYDERRGRVVLFGGSGDDGLLNDTWEWDGTGWERVSEDGPSPRFAARLAYDAALDRVVLYGGRAEAGNLADTWEWDGREWTLIGDAGPGPRNVHSLSWDPDRERLVMVGGLGVGGRRGDLWERHGRRWMRTDAPGHVPGDDSAAEPGAAEPDVPAGRGAAIGGWDPAGQRLLVFGGIGAEPRAFGDHWAWSRAGWSLLGEPPPGESPRRVPSPRFNAAGAFLPGPGQLVVYGGGGIDERRGDTWVFEGEEWREVERPGPPVRYCARMVARPDRGDAILYGGVAEDGTVLRETWRWDGAVWSRMDVGPGPPGACFHAMAYDAARQQVVHFGGRGTEAQGRDTWVLDGEGWRRVDRAGPPARDHHAMAWNSVRSEVVLFGGGGQGPDGEWDGTALSDTWTWDGNRWTRHYATSAPARFHAPLMVAAGAEGVLLFGGSSPEGSHSDLWQWDGRRWHLLFP